jgi:hypothetical protein
MTLARVENGRVDFDLLSILRITGRAINKINETSYRALNKRSLRILGADGKTRAPPVFSVYAHFTTEDSGDAWGNYQPHFTLVAKPGEPDSPDDPVVAIADVLSALRPNGVYSGDTPGRIHLTSGTICDFGTQICFVIAPPRWGRAVELDVRVPIAVTLAALFASRARARKRRRQDHRRPASQPSPVKPGQAQDEAVAPRAFREQPAPEGR